MIGYINSYETMGLVDGPGVRFVVFMQGCPLRCLYCHNPETWELNKGEQVSALELFNKIKSYKNYFGEDGGVTFSGGEPLLQPEFLIEVMELCRKEGIHTCLDTAGFVNSKTEEVLKYTDLVILDVKATNNELYKKITSHTMDKFNDFLKLCEKLDKDLWLRQVIVPGINDNEESILELKDLYKSLKNVKKIQLMPYHTHGKDKYKKLGMEYPLNDTKAMEMNKLNELQKLLEE